jgi:hypothetical protein
MESIREKGAILVPQADPTMRKTYTSVPGKGMIVSASSMKWVVNNTNDWLSARGQRSAE